MNNTNTMIGTQVPAVEAQLPRYEAPRIQAMSEKDILNSFQITQSMAAWWNAASC